MVDLISRQAAIEAVGINTWAGFRLKDLPSVQLERRKGKWIPVRFGDCKCSFCSETYGIIGSLLGSYNYCPNCGAEMSEEGKLNDKIY